MPNPYLVAGATFPPGDLAQRREYWEQVMGLALSEARLALRHGDVPVGAVIVGPNGELIAAAHNRREELADPTAHAEILALQQAAHLLREDRLKGPAAYPNFSDTAIDVLPAQGSDWRLTGSTLVVTLEPCVMCAGAILAARLERVVFGAWDAKAGACGSVWDLVRDAAALHQVEVIPEILPADSKELLQSFFQPKR